MIVTVQTGRYVIRNGNGRLAAAATTAAGGGFFHGIGHRRLREVQRIERRTGAVLCVQNGALIGEQCLVSRNILFALQVPGSVSGLVSLTV